MPSPTNQLGLIGRCNHIGPAAGLFRAWHSAPAVRAPRTTAWRRTTTASRRTTTTTRGRGRSKRLAREHGLRGRRLLDVGCGTGKSFRRSSAAGTTSSRCDVAPAMVARARAKAPGVPVHVCDVRALPRARAVRPRLLPRRLPQPPARRRRPRARDRRAWQATSRPAACSSSTSTRSPPTGRSSRTSTRSDRTCAGAGAPRPISRPARWPARSCTLGATAITHVQRHHPEPAARAAIAGAGLRCVAVYGQGLDGVPHRRARRACPHQGRVRRAARGEEVSTCSTSRRWSDRSRSARFAAEGPLTRRVRGGRCRAPGRAEGRA